MLTMADINTIRNLRNKHDKSINHIRKEMGLNWRTVKKYADEDSLPQVTIKKKAGMMYDEHWGEIVSLWLIEDSRLTRKKRRTRFFIFEELKKIGFPGSYRTVCAFIQEWKATHVNVTKEERGFERLEHPPAEAQLDFGTMEVAHKGHFKDVKVLVLTFPYSNAGFAVVLPAENQECLLEGMKELFKQVGGVPNKIRIDNMVTAVITPRRKGKPAELTDGFLQFATHYGFDTQTCNPRSGHEKGSVENKVGYVRYRFFSDTPIMETYDAFNQALANQLTSDRKRPHYEKGKSIDELWHEEKEALLLLPESDYPIFKEVVFKANKYNEITLDQTRIHVPRLRNHALIHGLLTYESFKLIGCDGEIITEGPRPYMNQKRAIDWCMVLHDWRKKRQSMPYSRYWKYLPERLKLYLSHPDWKEQLQRLDYLLSLLVRYDMSGIDQHFYELIETHETVDSYQVNWQSYDASLPRLEVK